MDQDTPVSCIREKLIMYVCVCVCVRGKQDSSLALGGPTSRMTALSLVHIHDASSKGRAYTTRDIMSHIYCMIPQLAEQALLPSVLCIDRRTAFTDRVKGAMLMDQTDRTG